MVSKTQNPSCFFVEQRILYLKKPRKNNTFIFTYLCIHFTGCSINSVFKYYKVVYVTVVTVMNSSAVSQAGDRSWFSLSVNNFRYS